MTALAVVDAPLGSRRERDAKGVLTCALRTGVSTKAPVQISIPAVEPARRSASEKVRRRDSQVTLRAKVVRRGRRGRAYGRPARSLKVAHAVDRRRVQSLPRL